jgi:hypothetical protein
VSSLVRFGPWQRTPGIVGDDRKTRLQERRSRGLLGGAGETATVEDSRVINEASLLRHV